MEYPIYQNTPDHETELLSQGDILDASVLSPSLKGHQDYFANRPYFYRFMVLTQSCDLNRDRGMADFIFLAVIRRLREAIGIRHVENSTARNRTDKLLVELYNHNYNERGFFYLPENPQFGIDEDSVVDLRVMFSLYRSHYDTLLKSRLGAMTALYAAKLGHIAGHMFNRVATPGWEELNPGENFSKKGSLIQTIRERFHERENDRIGQLKVEQGGKCAYRECDKNAETYRWVFVGSQESESGFEDFALCHDHAKAYDDGKS